MSNLDKLSNMFNKTITVLQEGKYKLRYRTLSKEYEVINSSKEINYKTTKDYEEALSFFNVIKHMKRIRTVTFEKKEESIEKRKTWSQGNRRSKLMKQSKEF